MRSRRLFIVVLLLLLLGALAPAASHASPAPVLSVHGETLEWTTAGAYDTYKLYTGNTPSAKASLLKVVGRTITPPAVPGTTVGYRVKAAYGESQWSNRVTITYPGGTEEGEEEEPPEEEPEEVPEEPPLEEDTLPRAPVGVPVPAGGWNVVFADAFAEPIGTQAGHDNLWQLPEINQPGFNSNELEVWNPSQVKIGPNGLELACTYERNAGGTGKDYVCGYVKTLDRFTLQSYLGSTFALECVCRWPVNTGEADPAWWHDGNEGGRDQEIDDFEGFGWNSAGSREYGAAIPAAVGLGGKTVYHDEGVKEAFGFDPTTGFHRYTTVIKPGALGHTVLAEYLDGVFKWKYEVATPLISVKEHLILSYALREYSENFRSGQRDFDIRSVEVFQDAAHAGLDVTGGGIAIGTKLGL